MNVSSLAAMPKPSSSDSPAHGSRASFSLLMRTHHRELILYAATLTGDHHAGQDLVQDAFVTAYSKFASFDTERDFAAWMRGIVRNKCRDWFRRQRRAPIPLPEATHIEIGLAVWQTARTSGTGSVFDALESCLASLPTRLGDAVRAFYLHDQAGQPAAETLGISPASLRKRLERARRQLHDCISRKLQPQPPSQDA
jgi:RNA polymerase sigma factor CnrH